MSFFSAAGSARLANLILRIIQVCASAIIFGIFAYFVATLGDHDLHIEPWHIAVTAISGAAMVYSIIASALALILGGKPFFAAIGMGLDFIFGVGMVAIAIMDRAGTQSCTGRVSTPLGTGDADTNAPGFGDGGFGVGDGQKFTYMADLKLACRLQKATFAVSIIAIFLYFVSIVTQRMHSTYAQRPTFDNTPVRDPLKRSWWPFGKKKTPADHGVDAEAASIGSIPLTEQPTATDKQLEDNPPRYTGLFGWAKRSSVNKGAGPDLTKVKSVGSSNYDNPYDSTYDNNYGNNNYAANNNTWSGSTWNDYNYGSSGVGDNSYSYGYGDTAPGFDSSHNH